MEITSRPPRSYTFPFLSTISKSPSTRNEPLLFTVIFVVAIVIRNEFKSAIYRKRIQKIVKTNFINK
jgi:hypothetical protein